MSPKTMLWFFFVAYWMQLAVSTKTVSELKREILNQILSKDENDVFVAPGNGVTDVETSLHVLDVEDVNERDMEFTLVVYFRQAWRDPRLKYVSHANFDFVSVSDDGVLWTPDTFFVNQKRGHGFDLVRPNVFVRIYPDGSVICSRKLSVTLGCPMDLSRFPFDRQLCSMRMESYGSGTDSILLKWKDQDPVSISDTLTVNLFELEKMVSSSGSARFSTGEYSFLTLNFYFARKMTHCVLTVYLPSIAMVALSWLPFWLKKHTLAARLLISVALLMTYMMTVLRFQPKIAYATSLTYFTWMCTAFLAASVLLQALSNNETVKECVETGTTRHTKANFIAFLIPLTFALLCVVYFATAGGFSTSETFEIPGNKSSLILIK